MENSISTFVVNDKGELISKYLGDQAVVAGVRGVNDTEIIMFIFQWS